MHRPLLSESGHSTSHLVVPSALMESSPPIYNNTGSIFSFPSPADDDPPPMYHTGKNFFSDEAPLRCGLSPPPPRVPGGFDGIDLNSQASSFPNLESYTEILRSLSAPIIRDGQCHPPRRDSQVPPPRRGGVSRFTRDGPTRQSTHTGSRVTPAGRAASFRPPRTTGAAARGGRATARPLSTTRGRANAVTRTPVAGDAFAAFPSGTVECGETSVLNASAPTSFGNPWRVQDDVPNNEDEDFTDDISDM